MLGRLANLVWQWIKGTKKGWAISPLHSSSSSHTPSLCDLGNGPALENWRFHSLNIDWVPVLFRALSQPLETEWQLGASRCPPLGGFHSSPSTLSQTPFSTTLRDVRVNWNHWTDIFDLLYPPISTTWRITQWGKCCGVDGRHCSSRKALYWLTKRLWNASQAPRVSSAAQKPRIQHSWT